MSYTVEVLEQGPVTIIISRFSGHLTREVFSDWNQTFDRMGIDLEVNGIARLYSIMIVPPGTTTDFGTIVEEMRVAPDDVNLPGGTPDRFRMMFVSQEGMVKLAVQLAKRSEFFGGQDVPMFRTLDDALAHIAVDRQSVEQGTDDSVPRGAAKGGMLA
jgi:hypothetical protein